MHQLIAFPMWGTVSRRKQDAQGEAVLAVQNSPKDFFLLIFRHPHACLQGLFAVCALLPRSSHDGAAGSWPTQELILFSSDSQDCPGAVAHAELCAGDSSVPTATARWPALLRQGAGPRGKVTGLHAGDRRSPSASLREGTKSRHPLPQVLHRISLN